MSTVTFENIFLGSSTDIGKLRFNAAGFGWKAYSNEENNPTTFSGSDVRAAAWFRVARNFQLRLTLRHADKPRLTFDGFKREDQDKVRRTLDDYFQIKMESKDTSLKGWNWGTAAIQGNDITFLIQNKLSFDLPLSTVSNSNIAGKNEVALEFTPPPQPAQPTKSQSTSRQPDELVEMRFYVPGKSMKHRDEAPGEGEDDEEGDGDETELDDDGNEVSKAEAMHNLIKEKADIGGVVGESIVVFEDVLILTPRGRYALEFFPQSLRLLGKSTDYRIPYTSIHRIFLLPKVDDLHVQLVLGLDPPIRQGATRYPFLVAQWPKDEEVDAELNIKDEDMDKYEGLQKKYEAPTFQVISRVLKSLTGKKVTPPGGFRAAQGVNGIKANVKAVQGELYFLEKGLIFIAKQPILIDFSKTESITFSRTGAGIASARTFDLRAVSKTESADHVFSSISKEEEEAIKTYLKSKGVRVKDDMDELAAMAMEVDEEDEEDEEDDVEGSEGGSIASVDDERAGGRGKGKGKGKGETQVRKGGNDDDDESEDESFQGSSSDGGSPSESDSDDSGAETDASDPLLKQIKKGTNTNKNKKGEESSAEEGDRPRKKKSKKD